MLRRLSFFGGTVLALRACDKLGGAAARCLQQTANGPSTLELNLIPGGFMYVLVHHRPRDRRRFWSTAEQAMTTIPENLKLHHTFSAKNGSRATCLWEGDSVDSVRQFVEPLLGSFATNKYAEAENREGVALPSRIPEPVPAKI